MAAILLAESGIQNDNSGQLVAVINADTSTAKIANAKVTALALLGTSEFSAYPLVVGTDLPAATESNYLANDNTGNIVSIINADTSTTKIANGKLAGNLVDALTAGTGISVSNPSGVGAATVNVNDAPNSALAGPLLTEVTAGTGISVGTAPTSVTSQSVALKTAATGGVGIIEGRAVETELTTTSATSIATYTPGATVPVLVSFFFRVVTAATTVVVTCAYKDGAASSQTLTLVPSSSYAVGNYQAPTALIVANDTEITVSATAGTDSQVYCSAIVESM